MKRDEVGREPEPPRDDETLVEYLERTTGRRPADRPEPEMRDDEVPRDFPGRPARAPD